MKKSIDTISLAWFSGNVRCGLADLDPEFQKLPVDPGRSPPRIRLGHLADEISNLLRHFWPSRPRLFRPQSGMKPWCLERGKACRRGYDIGASRHKWGKTDGLFRRDRLCAV